VVAVAAAGTGSPGALAVAIAAGLVWGQLAGVSITYLRRVNARLVPDPGVGQASARQVESAHLGAILLDLVRGVIVTLAGVVVVRPLVAGLAASWPLPAEATLGLLLVGGSVSVGILLRDFGGLRRHGAVFAVGLALAVLGAGLL